MPDDTKQPQAPDYDAEYAKAQRPAPAVPLHVHADKGWIPGVAMRGSGPGGDFTAEDTHNRLTYGQYKAGLAGGILSAYAESKAAPDTTEQPRRRRSAARKRTVAAPAPVVEAAPEPKEGDA